MQDVEFTLSTCLRSVRGSGARRLSSFPGFVRQVYALQLLRTLAKSHQSHILQAGGVQCVVDLLRRAPTEAWVQEVGLTVLWLSASGNDGVNEGAVFNAGALEVGAEEVDFDNNSERNSNEA